MIAQAAADPGWYQTIRPYFELASFASGPVVALITGFALWQIWLTKRSLQVAADSLEVAKKDIKLRSEREAFTLTATLLTNFAAQTNQMLRVNFQTIETVVKAPLARWPLVNYDFDQTTIKDWERAGRAFANAVVVNTESRTAAETILNELESYSVYFVSKVADEDPAYTTTAALVCHAVEVLAPVLIAYRLNIVVGAVSGSFNNLVTLYAAWSLRAQEDHAKAIAAAVDQQRAGVKQTRFRPRGTQEGDA